MTDYTKDGMLKVWGDVSREVLRRHQSEMSAEMAELAKGCDSPVVADDPEMVTINVQYDPGHSADVFCWGSVEDCTKMCGGTSNSNVVQSDSGDEADLYDSAYDQVFSGTDTPKPTAPAQGIVPTPSPHPFDWAHVYHKIKNAQPATETPDAAPDMKIKSEEEERERLWKLVVGSST